MMMKVLLIDACYAESSTGEIAYNIVKGVIDRGGEAELLYALGKSKKEEFGFKFAYTWEIFLHALLSRITGWFCEFSYLSTLRLVNEIKRFQPDIIHIHDPKPYYFNLYLFLKYIRKLNIKTIITLHSEFFYTGKCGYSLECMRWEADCGKCTKLRTYPKSLFFDHTEKMLRKKRNDFGAIQSLKVVCPSKWLADRARKSHFSDREIITIYNGVDTDVFRFKRTSVWREKYGLQQQKIILSAAPDIMSERKGGKWIVELASEMKQEEMFFVIAGAKELKREDNILYMPLVRDKNLLANLYNSSDLFLLCSQKETFSMTCAESLCCGTRVAGFESGAPETIFKKPYAYFVKYGDIQELRKTILFILGKSWKEEDRKKLSLYAAGEYGTDKMVDGYCKLYEDIAVNG